MGWRISMLAAAMLVGFTFEPATAAPPDARRAAADARAIFDRNAATRPAQWAIETGRLERVEASLIFVAAAPRMSNLKEWVFLGPMPPDHPSIANVKVESTPAHTEVREKIAPRRPGLMWRIVPADPAAKFTTLSITYTLDLVPRRLVVRPATAPAHVELGAEERAACTAAGTLTNFDTDGFQAWLAAEKLRPRPDETDIDFARRAFQHIDEKAGFDFKATMDRRATAVCKVMKSDCAGLSSLYVAVLRANGIPARQLIGRWAQSSKKDEKLEGIDWQQEHVKSEFFAAGVGWVPVDISVAVQLDKTPGSLRHFGRDDGGLVLMHIDPDVRLDGIHPGFRSVQFLQGPEFHCIGTGSMEGRVSRSDWQVKTLKGGRFTWDRN